MSIGNRLVVTATKFEADRVRALWIPRSVPSFTSDSLAWTDQTPAGIRVVGVTGLGPNAARRGLGDLLNRFQPVAWVLGTGLAGGIAPAACSGAVVAPDSVRWNGKEWAPRRRHPFTSLHRLITVDRVVHGVEAKAGLFSSTGCDAVDTESGVWAEVCEERNIPWGVVRSVLDGFNDELPTGMEEFIDCFGRPLPWPVFGRRLVGRPAMAAKMYRVHRLAVKKAFPPLEIYLRKILADEGDVEADRSSQPTVGREVVQLPGANPAQKKSE